MKIKKDILVKKLNNSNQNNHKSEIYHIGVSASASSSDKTFVLNSKYSYNSNKKNIKVDESSS